MYLSVVRSSTLKSSSFVGSKGSIVSFQGSTFVYRANNRSYATAVASSKENQLWGTFKATLSNFKVGTSTLFQNAKKAGELKRVNRPLSRAEYNLVRTSQKDVIRAVPLVSLFAIPILGYAALLVPFIAPGVLPSTFQTKEQQMEKVRKPHAERKSTIWALLQLLTKENQRGFYNLDPVLEKVFGKQLESVGAALVHQSIHQSPPLTDFSSKHIALLYRFYTGSAASYPLLAPLYRRSLFSLGKHLIQDDQEGTSHLSVTALEEACSLRGMELPEKSLPDAEKIKILQSKLDSWLRIARDIHLKTPEVTPAFQLHSLVLQSDYVAQCMK